MIYSCSPCGPKSVLEFRMVAEPGGPAVLLEKNHLRLALSSHSSGGPRVLHF